MWLRHPAKDGRGPLEGVAGSEFAYALIRLTTRGFRSLDDGFLADIAHWFVARERRVAEWCVIAGSIATIGLDVEMM
jgi:hypothetical protein